MSQGPFSRRVAIASALLVCAVAMLGAIPAAQAASFGSPVVVTGDDLGEPGIDVAKDGTIYVNAPTGLLSNLPGSPSDVFRSTDGGATWVNTPAGGRANLPGGGDSDISLDPATGKIYMTDLWLGSATVSTSADKGQTWTAKPQRSGPRIRPGRGLRVSPVSAVEEHGARYSYRFRRLGRLHRCARWQSSTSRMPDPVCSRKPCARAASSSING